MKTNLYTTKLGLLLAFALLLGLSSIARERDTTRSVEIGVRVSNTFSTIDYIKKKSTKKDPTIYKRRRIIMDGNNLLSVKDLFSDNRSTSSSLLLSFAYGKERRHPLKHNFSLVTGRDMIFSLNGGIGEYYDQEWEQYYVRSNAGISFGAGFVFGVNYSVKDKLILGIETIPSFVTGIRASFDSSGIDAYMDLFDFRFNRGIVGLNILYKF